VDYEPISVALKFGFLAVLYLFLLWIARSALKDLRRTVSPAPDATGFHAAPVYDERRGDEDAWLVVERGGGLREGERFDLFTVTPPPAAGSTNEPVAAAQPVSHVAVL